MDYCWLLTSVTLDLPRLRSISIGHNRKYWIVTTSIAIISFLVWLEYWSSVFILYFVTLSRIMAIHDGECGCHLLCLQFMAWMTSLAFILGPDLLSCLASCILCRFGELTLRSPALTLLNLSYCPALSRIDISSSSFEVNLLCPTMRAYFVYRFAIACFLSSVCPDCLVLLERRTTTL